MADKSLIEWTDATWPIVQGCDPVSPGCAHCYVPKELWRMLHNPNPAIAAPLQGTVDRRDGVTRFTGKVALRHDRLAWPLGWKAPRKIFVPSHGDIFHEAVPDHFIDRIFAIMALCPQHTFQVLTKRPDRMRAYLERITAGDDEGYLNALSNVGGPDHAVADGTPWPLPNVWLGVSAERQQEAAERIPHLFATPAARRFASLEPLLGPIELDMLVHDDGERVVSALNGCHGFRDGEEWETSGQGPRLDWVIVGGESGKDARPMHPDWARSLRDQCDLNGIAFFFKQWGDWASGIPVASGEPGHFALWHEGGSCWTFCAESPRHFARFGADARMSRVGKKRAGRLLDGVEHNAFPPSQGFGGQAHLTTTGANP